MGSKRYPPEQAISRLREAEVLLGKGQSITQACRKLGITDQTYCRWRKEYGSMRVSQARRLKGRGDENAQLKKLVANQALDIAILKEAELKARAEGNS